jgi:glycosyltransferase involved in cell wall biosynthesis
MRITLVSETYSPQVNGVSRTLMQLVRVLEAEGDRVQLVHPDYRDGDGGAASARVVVRSMPVPFYRELHLPLPPFGRVRATIDQFGPQIIHIATEATLGLAVLKHARARGIPLVTSFHTNFDQYTEHYRIGWLSGVIWRYLRWFHNEGLETYVPSRATMAILDRRGFERLVLWPRGVDSVLFRPDRPGREKVRLELGFGPEHVVVGHVSRIAAEKNVAYLGAALERLEADWPDRVRVLVVGDGPAREELAAQLGARARFVGYRSGEDLADHYAACDLFAFASKTETFGNVLLEAMASGLPVVAVRAGGPADTVRPGETGFLVEPTDSPKAMAAALGVLVGDDAERCRMGMRAREFAEGQSWEAIMRELRGRYLCLSNSIEGLERGSPARVMGAGTA